MASGLALEIRKDSTVPDADIGSTWAISRIALGDAEAIAVYYAGFENEKRPVSFWRERLRLWWQANPAFASDWHPGVKMTVGNQIVGVLCALPIRVLHDGRQVTGAALTSWRVDKEYRSGSIAMFEAAIEAHATRPLFDTTPTPSVIRLLNYYGFDRPRDAFPASKLIANPLRLLARLIKAAPIRLDKTHFFVNDKPVSADEASALVDSLWQRSISSTGTMGVKDGAYFRWYCHEGRTNGRFGVAITDAQGVATGMAVVLDMGDGVAWMVDMWCDFIDVAAIKKLISTARRHASRLGFHCLWVPHVSPTVANACGIGGPRPLPVSAFFKIPGGMPSPETSYWTIAVGDFGA